MQVSQWYELVIFTASLEIYGAGVADHLDNGRHIFQRRFFRQHCLYDSGSYSKDLSRVSTDLSSIFILDNSPGAYRSFPGELRVCLFTIYLSVCLDISHCSFIWFRIVPTYHHCIQQLDKISVCASIGHLLCLFV